MNLEAIIGEKLLLAFEGTQAPSSALVSAIHARRLAGVTLFRGMNVQSPAQVRELTSALQREAEAAGIAPLLIATDQEGGQLIAIGGTTPFPGNMALGATRSEALARETGRAIALELAAMGINVNYAPVCDVNSNPDNPVIGIRSFGEDPALVGRLCAAMIEGMQSVGIAATAKHFPGHGDTTGDSHLELPTVHHGRERLEQVDLPPFRAAIEAGVALLMSAHVAYPALDAPTRPATLSRAILTDLLRGQMGFRGVVVSDAMNMRAIRQGEALWVELIAAARAGVDLLLLLHDAERQRAAHTVLVQAVRRGLLSAQAMEQSAQRVRALRQRLARLQQPALSVVGSPAHREIARRTAEAALTLVRDEAGLLPLRLPPDATLLLILPQPRDLTPADTSSYERIELAEALRRYHPRVEAITVPFAPDDGEIAAVRERAVQADLILVGTINAFAEPRQAALVEALRRTGRPLILAALRLPYDVGTLVEIPTALCTYSLQPPAMEALAKGLFGHMPITGKLPVSLKGGNDGTH